MPSLSERLPIFLLHLFFCSQENSLNATQSMDLEHCSIQFLLIAKHLNQICSTRVVLGQICVLCSRPCAHEFCVWWIKFSFRLANFVGSISFRIVSFRLVSFIQLLLFSFLSNQIIQVRINRLYRYRVECISTVSLTSQCNFSLDLRLLLRSPNHHLGKDSMVEDSCRTFHVSG